MVDEIRHVVFIGETGSGKSSVINLIAGGDIAPARVSSDAAPCTVEFASCDVPIRNRTYRLWDTPGLNRPGLLSRFGLFRRATSTGGRGSLKRFLHERHRRGELDLIVFCVQGRRAHNGVLTVYDRFCRPTREKTTIPVALAVTHLEKQQPTMETWWQDNERSLMNLGLEFDGHACVTCLSPHHRRWASHEEICDLILERCHRRQATPVSGMEYLDQRPCVVC